MPIFKIDHFPTESELVQLTRFFSDYIKVVADINQKILYGGSEFHADIEKILLDQGSLQENIWGGGVNLKTRKIDCLAIINIRPGVNPDPNILDQNVREKFINVVKSFFPEFIYG